MMNEQQLNRHVGQSKRHHIMPNIYSAAGKLLRQAKPSQVKAKAKVIAEGRKLACRFEIRSRPHQARIYLVDSHDVRNPSQCAGRSVLCWILVSLSAGGWSRV